MVILISIGYAVDAEHGKKFHHNKHGNRKEHQMHTSKTQAFEKAHKKAEIDFSSNEFTDSNDDSPDDDQSEKGTFHEICLLIGFCLLM